MPFPEGDYGSQLKVTPGPGHVVDGTTAKILSYVAGGEISFGKAVRRGTVAGTCLQGVTGTNGTAGTPASIVGTGDAAALATIQALGVLVAITFNGEGVEATDFGSATSYAAVATRIQDALRTAVGPLSRATVSYAGNNFTVTFANSADGPITGFAGTPAATLAALGLDTVSITAPTPDTPGSAGDFLGFALRNPASREDPTVHYSSPMNVQVLIAGRITAALTAGSAGVGDEASVELGNTGNLTANVPLATSAPLDGVSWVDAASGPDGLGTIQLIAVEQE